MAMPVTEFALLQTRSSRGDDLEFLEALMEIQEGQDAWAQVNQPHNLKPGENLSSMYAEVASQSEPPSLLITAPWDSPEAHAEWTQSGANQAAMAKLREFLAPGGGSVLLFHMEPAGRRAQIRGAFAHKDSRSWFDVCRMTVMRDQREGVQRAYRALEEELHGAGLGQGIWAGWRIEKAGEDEELVVLWGNDVAREKLEGLLRRSENKDHRQFMHVV